jgi:hypothetical protein
MSGLGDNLHVVHGIGLGAALAWLMASPCVVFSLELQPLLKLDL